MLTFARADGWLFQTFRPCCWPQVESTYTSSPTLAKANDHPGHQVHTMAHCFRKYASKAHCGYTEARRTAGTPEQGAPTNRVNVERACAECYSKSVRPHLTSLMPAFPSEARGRVSRHLFKSRNFRPFSMTAAFLVTAKHCLR